MDQAASRTIAKFIWAFLNRTFEIGVFNSNRCRSGLNRQASHAPFRKAVLQPATLETSGAKRGDGLEGQNAIRAAAICDERSDRALM